MSIKICCHYVFIATITVLQEWLLTSWQWQDNYLWSDISLQTKTIKRKRLDHKQKLIVTNCNDTKITKHINASWTLWQFASAISAHQSKATIFIGFEQNAQDTTTTFYFFCLACLVFLSHARLGRISQGNTIASKVMTLRHGMLYDYHYY